MRWNSNCSAFSLRCIARCALHRNNKTKDIDFWLNKDTTWLSAAKSRVFWTPTVYNPTEIKAVSCDIKKLHLHDCVTPSCSDVANNANNSDRAGCLICFLLRQEMEQMECTGTWSLSSLRRVICEFAKRKLQTLIWLQSFVWTKSDRVWVFISLTDRRTTK